MQRGAEITDSYINANYINSSIKQNDQAFIATQGPLPKTRENFWRMVMQENVHLIINLTKIKEHGKIKCDQYWPVEVGESVQFYENDEEYSITLIQSESLMKNLIRRKLTLSSNSDENQIREIIQLNYISWPDHGAPEKNDYLIIRKLHEYITEYHRKPQTCVSPQSQTSKNQNSKIIFHCSAGIGRTGTMLAIYNIIESLKILMENEVPDSQRSSN